MRRVVGAALAMVMLLACGCGSSAAVDEGTIASSATSTPSQPASQPQNQPPPATGGPQIHYQVWLQRGARLWPVTRSGPRTVAVGRAAMQALLAGPTRQERRHGVGTVIPAGTTLLGLTLDHGTATVDLSSDYQAGGGALSMTVRLAQVVYTLTQFPTVKRVDFALDGRPVTVFSNEGIVLDRPQTRSDYESVLPVIAVASPGFGQTLHSPVTVSGLANVFEANVSVELLDAHGTLLTKGVTTATCGTGCWGSYSLRLSYSVATRQQGTLVVHDDDAAGMGSYPHELRIPVVLTP
jgi:germination protein M